MHSFWFTDPPFQTANNDEGYKVVAEQPDAVYRIDGETDKISRVVGDLTGPTGLCFSPDEKGLYVVEIQSSGPGLSRERGWQPGTAMQAY